MTDQYALDVSLARDIRATLDPFTFGYVEAAMWTLTGDDGEPLDYLGLHDIAPQTIRAAIDDCNDFKAQAEAQLDQAAGEAQNGHDFWLTRNHHGAGFWDRGYGDVGRTLTDLAHGWGECNWYVGDDGMVYQAGDENR